MANTYTAKLKLRMPDIGDLDWGDEVNDNVEILESGLVQVLNGNQVASGLAPSDGGGLQVDYTAGIVVINGTEYSISASNKTCAATQKNWLYVDSAGTVQISTTAPGGQYAMIAMVDADASAILRIADMRNMAESILSLDIDYTPDNYTLDTSETSEIEQHLAGIDDQLGFMGSFKNKIINGCFSVWQRQTSQTSNNYGSDDRWGNYHNGSTKTHSRQAFSLGQTDVPGEPKYFSRTVASSVAGAGNYVMKSQKIESVRTFAGQNACLSFYAKADASKNMAVEIYQHFGNGGSPSASVSVQVNTIALTTAWQKFTIPVSVDSISGKTLGANGDDSLQVVFWFEAGSNFDSRTNTLGQQSGTFDIAQVQFETGSDATEFEKRHFQTELALCQRYYEKSYRQNVYPGATDGAGSIYSIRGNGASGLSVFFKITKRTVPTVSAYSPDTGTINMVRNLNTGTDQSAGVGGIGDSAFLLGNGSASTNEMSRGHFIAYCEL